jgi:hypothetical protein
MIAGIYWAEVVPGDYVVGVLTAPTTLPNALLDEWNQVRVEGGDAVVAFAGRLNAAGLVLPSVTGVRMNAMTVTPPRSGWIAAPLTTSDGRLYAYPTTFHPAAVGAATAAIVTVRSGEEKPGINIQVTPRPLLRVSGRLLGPDGPMPGIVVRLITSDPATSMSSPPSQIDEAIAMTGRRRPIPVSGGRTRSVPHPHAPGAAAGPDGRTYVVGTSERHCRRRRHRRTGYHGQAWRQIQWTCCVRGHATACHGGRATQRDDIASSRAWHQWFTGVGDWRCNNHDDG